MTVLNCSTESPSNSSDSAPAASSDKATGGDDEDAGEQQFGGMKRGPRADVWVTRAQRHVTRC